MVRFVQRGRTDDASATELTSLAEDPGGCPKLLFGERFERMEGRFRPFGD
jgi:hypothetical protein